MKTLIAKADGRQLLEKVMPYLDIRLSSRDQASAISTVDISGLAGYSTIKSQTARCSEGEIISGGGYELSSSALGQNIPSYSSPTSDTTWKVQADFSVDGSLKAFAQCMKVEVGIKP